jgi:predicted Zn finger-like uncharacterized protein
MYTQCPECEVAFRVTAEVLRQAAGKVRCGGCGVAFNALNHLSEQKPAARMPAAPQNEAQVPQLTPDEPPELEADTPPKSISAEQSAALLKTLDQLAGSDIRIEDTGVEWRVLDEDDIDTSDAEQQAAGELIGDTGSLRFVIEDDDNDEPSPVIDEMRFDDNTPLPDDFDFLIEPESEPESVFASPPPEPEVEPMAMHAQVDLAFGDPEDWEELLGDLDETADDASKESIEVVESRGEPSDEESQDDLVVLADASDGVSIDDPLDMDTQFALQAKAMGIDLSGMHKTQSEDEPEQAPLVDAEIEGEEPESSIEDDLLAAAFEAEAAVQAMGEASSAAEALETEEDDDAELDGIEIEDFDENDELEPDETEIEDFGENDEPELDETEIEELDEDDADDIEIDLDVAAHDEEEPEDDVEDIALPFDDEVENIIETIAASLDDEPGSDPEDEPDDAPDNALGAATDDMSSEHVIPEMTEEEKTINMLIDQELFNIAFEDEDGFTSTIVQKQPDRKVESELGDNRLETRKKDKPEPLFETIIMEGESVRGDLDKERLAADRAARSGTYGGPGLSIPFKKENAKPGGRRDYDPPGAGTYIGIVALLLLLVVQALHQSREALATIPAFNNIVGPVYRLVGQPLTPTWNISGWRFEATKGSTETAGSVGDTGDLAATAEPSELLTIYSRVGNKSDDALPYPLVHLSLTDRFEEIVGSIVLEPSDYLAENADPRKLVPPGNTFNAVISIESPSPEATGFKLNVCYRLASGQLRCAVEDFK